MKVRDRKDDRNREIIAMRERGEKTDVIAKVMGISQARVSWIIKRDAPHLVNPKGRPNESSKHSERDAKIVALCLLGVTYARLSRDLNLAPERVRQIYLSYTGEA